jgi:RNA polymerase sigma factor (sigma-70 family)
MGDGESIRAVEVGRTADAALGSRKRAAIELIGRYEQTLRRTARRYSLCVDDAEDAFQRALEILLHKAPTSDQRELIRWMQTVTKHEALAVRRNRERHLGSPAPPGRDEGGDWIQLIPSENDGPADEAERHERIGRAREALKALKPQELRALTLLAEGYSYSEIGEITGWTYTKVNRCLAEGRRRFRAVLESIEEGRRCEQLAAALSAFVDGEATPATTAELLPHLRECCACRAKLRSYRAAPRAAALLLPALPMHRPLGERLHDLLGAAQARLPGRSGAAEAAVSQVVAAGGTRGSGMAVAAKILAACVGTAGGAAACVAAGVVPPPVLGGQSDRGPRLERPAHEPKVRPVHEVVQTVAEPAPQPTPQPPHDAPPPDPAPAPAPAAPPPPPPPPAPSPPPPPAPVEFSAEAPAAPAASRQSGAEFGGGSGGGAGATAGGSSGEFGP